MRRRMAVALSAMAALALTPAAPVLAHEGEEHPPDVVEACGTEVTIHQISSHGKERASEDMTRFKATGTYVVHLVTADGREATIRSAGQFRAEMTDEGLFKLRATGRQLVYPGGGDEQVRREHERVGLPVLAIIHGRADAEFRGSPEAGGELRITRIPRHVQDACDLLR